MKFKYCPQCGDLLQQREIGDEGLMPFCTSCKRPYFEWFGQCVIVLVINEFNEVALLKQNYVSQSNWVLVAGYIKMGETAEESAKREVLEETGQESKTVSYISSYYHKDKELLMLGFIAHVSKTNFSKSKEVDAISWFKIDDVYHFLRKGSIAEEHFIKSIDFLGLSRGTA